MEAKSASRTRPLALIVRVWPEGDAVVVRGDVEHVYTGERRLFGAYETLVTVIEQWREDAKQDALR